ncbi:ABC transporter substrate-binding protein [Humitalea sp. 24SJ18S-53]|uniref:ABC transporter substrate-binding protein n=1 Tax=Humitalea sp. 24SJ18S-53 TaxID=3422307 RepID=UPI003D66B8B7
MSTITRRSIVAASLAIPAVVRAQPALTDIKFSLAAPLDGSNAAFFLAEERGWFREAGVRVQFDPSGGSGEAVTRVGSGTYDMGIADLGVLLDFNGKNPAAAARCVYMLYYRSPLCAASFARANINSAADLVGKRIGAALTDGAYRLFPAYAARTGIDASTIRWQYGDLRLREAMLLRGDAEAILGFDSTMFFGLTRNGARAADIKFLYFADAGMPLYGNGLIASKRLLESNPDAVRRFTAAAARGWQAAIADPAAAAAALGKREALIEVPLETERLRWLINNQLVTDESRADGLGGVRPDRIAEMCATVSAAFGLAPPVTPAGLFDAAFLPDAAIRRVPV